MKLENTNKLVKHKDYILTFQINIMCQESLFKASLFKSLKFYNCINMNLKNYKIKAGKRSNGGLITIAVTFILFLQGTAKSNVPLELEE